MLKEYIDIYRKYTLFILTLGFAYSATIVFTFFGPVLLKVAHNDAHIFSIIAVLSHVMAFYIKPNVIEEKQIYFRILIIILFPLILLFNYETYYVKIITIMFYAYTIGRIGCFWTYTANKVIPNYIRGRIISASLFFSFIILYFINIIIPIFSKDMSLLLPALTSTAAVLSYSKLSLKYKEKNIIIKRNENNRETNAYFIFLFLTVIYIAGGFSYAGIYPSFRPYEYIDRYFNVLFYIIAIVFAGRVLDRQGRKIAFMLGVGLLGISFTFFIMPSSVVAYLITQTFLQAGWAFVNAFGWSFSWDMAERTKIEYFFPRGISAMLFGTSIGGFLSGFIQRLGYLNTSIYGVVTFIPLFTAIIILVFFPETLDAKAKKKKITIEELLRIEELNILTPRETEVCCHLINGLTNKSISKVLFISENTVKTHISRIYSKLYVSSRGDLKKYIENIKRENYL